MVILLRLILFLRIVFAPWGLLGFHVNFSHFFPICMKNIIVILMAIASGLQIAFSYSHFHTMNFSIPCTWESFLSLRLFFSFFQALIGKIYSLSWLYSMAIFKSPLLTRKATNFYMLILCLDNFPKHSMGSRIFW